MRFLQDPSIEFFRRGAIRMQTLYHRIRCFVNSEAGPTATEYAVMLAFMLMVSLVVIQALGAGVTGMYSDINNAMSF
jgi:pilus assembly protein Flp/PilA